MDGYYAGELLRRRLPPRLQGLEVLACDFWWSWHRTARELFKRLDPMLWRTTRHNPVRMLLEVPSDRLEQLARDPAFLQEYEAVLLERARELGREDHWYACRAPQHAHLSVVYVSAEFGVHTSLPIYSGGLGVLAGDLAKEASDLGVPLIGLGFLYQQGYFRQRLDADGWQEAVYPPLHPEEAALHPVLRDDGTAITVRLRVGERDLHLRVWEVRVGRTRLYLLDADVEPNAPWDRQLTARLYGGDLEMRLQQEILLGIGGVRVLRLLGLEPTVWHLNEEHTAFVALERLREYVARGLSPDEAAQHVRTSTIFTFHTPYPWGQDIFPLPLIERYFRDYWPQLGMDRASFAAMGCGQTEEGFSMTRLALTLSCRANGVSAEHERMIRRVWHVLWPEHPPEEMPIGHVTGGVHLPSWVGPTLHRLYRRHLAPDWPARQSDAALWERVEDIPDSELWQAHLHLKRKMLAAIREHAREGYVSRAMSPEQLLTSGLLLDPDALTIGFARQFTPDQRADLIFQDADRLLRLLHDRHRPVQFIFAGKAHPADEPGKRLLRTIYNWARRPEMGGRIAFVEDYDMHLARYLVQGVDVWLSTPRPPRGVSSTSGMKAAINGVLPLGIATGWWAEAHNGRNGWAIPPQEQHADEARQDASEARLLYELLEEQVVPLFYRRDRDGVPRGWVAMMCEAIRTVGTTYTTRRMMQTYVEQCYLPAGETTTLPDEIAVTAQ